MLKRAALLVMIAVPGHADAAPCPDFFRFVDFGQKAPDGVVYRGGPIFRAESLEGQPLLLRDQTECRAVRDVSPDGHGNPIPVVTRVHYAPKETGLPLIDLQLFVMDDPENLARETAAAHVSKLSAANADITRGEHFLCAGNLPDKSLSCQLVSPYSGAQSPVVYCDATTCSMPMMLVKANIAAAATWPRPAASSQETGQDAAHIAPALARMLDSIKTFLAPLS